MGVLSGLYGIVVIFPLIGYVIAFLILKLTTSNHKKAVMLSVDITTFIFLLSVHHLLKVVTGDSYFWLIIIIMILIAAVIAFLFYKFKGELDLDKLFKAVWRAYFILFAVAYIVLMIIGLYKNISFNIAL